MSTTRPPVLITEPIHAAATAKIEVAGHPVIEPASPVPLTHPGLLGRAERVVRAGHAGSTTVRTRERMSLLVVEGLLRSFG